MHVGRGIGLGHLREHLLGVVEQARLEVVLRRARTRPRGGSSGGRSSRFTRSWCMRIARSTSPRRRKRLPSANCSSTVCGFSFATCRNDSIALSGCSFSRKLRPRKYDEGSARDSDSSDLMSTRAATQPMPKNTGRASSHQNSNSMDVGARAARGAGGAGGDRRGARGGLRAACAQPPDLAALAHHRRDPGEQPDHHAGHERPPAARTRAAPATSARQPVERRPAARSSPRTRPAPRR